MGEDKSHLPGCLRRYAAAVIGIAISFVLFVQWNLALHHTRSLQPHDLFLSSFASPLSGGNGRRAQVDDNRPLGKDGSAAANVQQPDTHDDGVAPYITSSICGGCTRSYFDARPCFTLVQREQKKSGLSLEEAASKVGKESKHCELCNPALCLQHYLGNNTKVDGSGIKAKYWRFDRASPKFSNPTTLTLKSIPDELRIPPSRFDDIGAYFSEKYNEVRGDNTGMNYLVEYNPGLVIIPDKMKQHLPKEAVYLVSLRVTPANNCFSTNVYEKLEKDVWNAVYHTSINHLGLALLDENYQMIPGYDVITEIDVQFDLKRDTSTKAGDAVSPTFMDYRIFVLNDEIYLHANMETVVVNRLSLRAKGFGDDAAYEKDVGTCADVAKEAGKMGTWEKPCRLDTIYGGDKLQVGLARQFNTIWSGGIGGKNYALFGVPNATHPDSPDSIYAEIDIFPHHVQQILPDQYEQLPKKEVFERIWKKGTSKSRRLNVDRVNMREVVDVGNTTESVDVPLSSFSTVDAHVDWFPGKDEPFKVAAHGGACCVSFSADDLNLGGMKSNGPLLVGIGHTKVTWKPWYGKKSTAQEQKDKVPHTHYVSLFYAFEPEPPFRIRARSGYFCLGHAPLSSDNELGPGEGGIFNPHSVLTRNRQLQQNFQTFDCPQMAFVSSFIEKAGDPSRTVIGYGLNDCTGRLIEVTKREIARLLYPDPMDMILEAP
ncbi:hypothetical protein ACHAXT_012457 [Thalassiosira profunda]